MNNEIKLKCIVCGADFTSEKQEEVRCPKCGRTFDFSRASKYAKSFDKILNNEKRVANGEKFLKVDMLLNEANFYIDEEDFENAKKKLDEALELTNTDVRVFMGYVKVFTKNFTDLEDNLHIQYFKDALEIADYNQKKELKKIYMPYYKKRNMTPEEVKEKTEEEVQINKKKVERILKDGIPKHFGLEKTNKAIKIITPIGLVLFVACVVLLFIIKNEIAVNIFSICGVFFSIVTALLAISYFNNIKKLAVFNFVLDFYDNYEKFEFSTQEEIEVNKYLEKFGISYLNGETYMSVEKKLSDLLIVINKFENEKFKEFCKGYKIIDKVIEKEIKEI